MLDSLISEAAPAKINLALHVTGRREDGYHLLDSLVVFADIADELTAEFSRDDHLSITGPFGKGLGESHDNLVMRAVRGFRQRWPGRVDQGLSLRLSKNLPVAAGLGGGSADAAAALRLMAGLANEPVPVAELYALAATLGADVSVCLLSRPCRMRGVGETITTLADFPAMHAVLINPLIPVSTPDVFRRLAHRDNAALPPMPEPLTRPAQLGIWLAETRNDLEPPAIALVPEIGGIIERLRDAQGCMFARMSGSGATVFGLFGSGAQAHQAAHELREKWPGYWVAAAPLVLPE